MLIGVISDTHDNAQNLIKAFNVFNKKKVDLVIHCGDWVAPFMIDFCKELDFKIISVFGNNIGDKFRFIKKCQEKEFDIETNDSIAEIDLDGRKAIAFHGDPKQLLDSLIQSQKYDVVFSGHTHKALIEKTGKTLHINPGSTCGIHGSEIDAEITIAFYDTKTDNAEIVNLE